MTSVQLQVLARLIEADRLYRSLRNAGRFVAPDDRGVEVSCFNGISKRTAAALEAAGLAETDTCSMGVLRLFLGKVEPFDYPVD